MRAADQSSRVAEEHEQEGVPAEVLESQPRSREIGEIERSRALADARCGCAGHAESPAPTELMAINEGDTIVHGAVSAAITIKMGFNFLIPFVVSNLGVLAGTERA